MKILIIGASSYVGARVYFDLSKDFDVTGTYHDTQLSKSFVKLDITTESDVLAVFSNVKPDVIIHIAANANSRWCEANPDLATALNETATKHIVEAANTIKAKVIFISSFAAFEPNNIYAKTKYNSELTVKNTKAGWVIIRASLVLGFSPNTTNDRPFNRLLRNLDKGEPAEYDTSWKFQPTYLGHISEVIRAVIERDINAETIPVAVDVLKSRYDTAQDILTPFGIEVKAADGKDTVHSSEKRDLNKLSDLNLPMYTYDKMITRIVEELKNREMYKL